MKEFLEDIAGPLDKLTWSSAQHRSTAAAHPHLQNALVAVRRAIEALESGEQRGPSASVRFTVDKTEADEVIRFYQGADELFSGVLNWRDCRGCAICPIPVISRHGAVVMRHDDGKTILEYSQSTGEVVEAWDEFVTRFQSVLRSAALMAGSPAAIDTILPVLAELRAKKGIPT